MSSVGVRRRMLRQRMFDKRDAQASSAEGSKAQAPRPTGIKAWDRLLRFKSNRIHVPIYSRSGLIWGTELVAPGQYVRGMKVRK